MKILAILLISLLSTQSVFASSVEIKLLGRGVQDRKTGETLAFQCVGSLVERGPRCNQIQLTNFMPDGSVVPLEEVYTIETNSDEPTDQEIEKFLKDFSLQFNRYKRQKDEQRRITGYALAGLAGGTAAMSTLNGQELTAKTQGIFLAALSIPVLFILIASKKNPVFSNVSKVGTALHSTEGWDWSIQPKKISHHKFNLLLEFGSTDKSGSSHFVVDSKS